MMSSDQPGSSLFFAEFEIDAKSGRLVGDGKLLALSAKTFDLLVFLAANAGRIVSKDEILNSVWENQFVEEANLPVQISALRKALGDQKDAPRFLVTMPGKGYKFVAEVMLSETSAAADGFSAAESHISDFQIKNQRPKTKNQSPKIYLLGALILLTAIISAVYFWRQTPTAAPVKNLAVLPFKSLVAANRDEVLEMGMADTLIARLGDNREIVVRSLSSVRKFGNLEQDALTAGRELGVDAVLDGSVQRVADKIRVNVRLIKTADGASLWNETFDEKFTDIFVVQDAISKKVAEALKLRLSDAPASPEKHSTENVEAYRFYLQGRYHALKSTPPEIRQGITFYQQAIAADPLYALAYAGMAQAYAALPITSDVPPNEAFPQAKAAANKALEIDAGLAEARIVLGVVEFWYDWDWKNAELELKKAIAINPNNSDAHRFYAVLLTILGRGDESLAEMELARQLDPLSLIVNALKGQAFFYAGRDAEAIDQSNKTLEIEPNFWIAHIMLARVYLRQNKFDGAFAEAQKAGEFSGGNSEAVSLAGFALAKKGETARARQMLQELKSNALQRYVPAYNIAMLDHGLGDREEALNSLEKAFTDHDARMLLLRVDPKWNNLRTEARFIELLRQMNFE